jgi:hypothetical protein
MGQQKAHRTRPKVISNQIGNSKPARGMSVLITDPLITDYFARHALRHVSRHSPHHHHLPYRLAIRQTIEGFVQLFQSNGFA